MIAVEPKRDCPHVDEHVSSSITKVVNVLTPCARCQDGTENWICCKCGEVFCSRFKNSHMVEHNKESSHAIAASFSDLSVWCYSCDSYIKHAVLNPILDALRESKFPAAAGSKPAEPKESPKPQGEKDGVTEGIAKLSIKEEPAAAPKTRTANILSSLTIDGIADYIKSGKCKNIIVMTGAGVSVAAGIPDFRTPGTGLYYNLQKYNLPYPTAVFEINYFRNKPEPFFLLAKELYPGNFVPTHVHYFIKLLHEKGLLLRNYTQNIDTLERVANIPASALVEAHGTFGTAHCIECRKEHSSEFVKDHVFSDKIPKCEGCSGLVKPDIVFFGESLPPRFFDMMSKDFPICDLLLVIGTSLKVQPFASLIKRVPPTTPRLLINMEEVGTSDLTDIILPSFSTGFVFNHANNVRDVKHLGECQSGVKRLAELCGWGQELAELVEKEQKIILASVPPTASTAPPSSTPSAPAPTPSTPSTPAPAAPTPSAAAAPVASPTPTTTPAPSLEASVNSAPSPSPAPSAPTPSTTPAPSSTPADAPSQGKWVQATSPASYSAPSSSTPSQSSTPSSSSTPPPPSPSPAPPSSTPAPPAEASSAAPAPSSDVPPASL